jgi:hypothetical protein
MPMRLNPSKYKRIVGNRKSAANSKVGLYKSKNSWAVHVEDIRMKIARRKPPGFNPCTYEVKTWFQAFAFKWVN